MQLVPFPEHKKQERVRKENADYSTFKCNQKKKEKKRIPVQVPYKKDVVLSSCEYTKQEYTWKLILITP